MSSDPLNDNPDLPPWLRDAPLPPRPHTTGEQTAGAPQPGPEQPAAGPDRLRDDVQSPPAPTGDQSQLPDWLRDRQAELPAAAGGPEQVPSWLLDIAGASGPAEAGPAASASDPEIAPTRPAGEQDLPDWLRDSQPDAAAPAAEQLPDWLRDMSSTPLDQSAPPADDAPPSWLAGTGQAASTPERPSADLPDWLRDQDPAGPPAAPSLDDLFGEHNQASQPPAAPSSGALPNWLDELDADPAQPVEDRAAPSQPDVPDWLQHISAETDDIDSAVEPFSFDDLAGPPSRADAPSLPTWLGSAEGADETGSTVPDWLAGTHAQPERTSDDTAPSAPSWLADASGPAASVPDSGPSAPDVPLWLQDIDQTTAPSAPQAATPDAWASTAPDDSAPAWLQDPSAEQPTAPAADDSVPAWLRDAPAEQPTAPVADDSVPAWLRDASAEQPAANAVPAWLQPEPTAPPAAENIPAWLQDTPAEQGSDVAPAAESVPAWLQSTGDAPLAGMEETSAPPDADQQPGDPDTLPDWLRPSSTPQAPPPSPAQDIPPWLRDEAGQPLPSAGAPGDTNLPAWLRGATFERTPPAEGSSAPPQSETQPGATNFDWFSDEAAPALPAHAANSSNTDLVGGIELPAWLRPPEPEQPKELNPTDARSLDWLTRLGGHEEEEAIDPAAGAPVKLKRPAAPARTAAQVEAIALLQRLAAEPYPEAAPAPEQLAPSVWRRFGVERLLYLALLIALVLVLALPVSGSLGLDAPPAAPGAADLFGQIDKLSENDTVLVGYEWDARRSGELRPLEQAVMSHLLQHKVKLVLVSTDAQGTLLMFDLRDELGAAGYKPSGEDYLLLGYKPGAELALRSFAQDFRGALRSDFQGNDATVSGLATDASGQPRLNRLGDFAMVLVLADEPADVQGWMEQVHPSARRADGSFVPFGFLLPAETAPIVQPYLSAQRGVYHLAGRQGALAYQQLRGDSAATAAQLAGEAGRLRLSLLVYAALFVIGALAVGIGGALARGRKRP